MYDSEKSAGQIGYVSLLLLHYQDRLLPDVWNHSQRIPLNKRRTIIMAVRGIRGATSVEQDTPEEILTATTELLEEIMRANEISSVEEIASAFFTTTADLTSCFPAEAARKLGWDFVPLLCATEIPVAGSLPHGVRILLHLNTDKKQSEIEHVYLRAAKRLRPDIKSAQ